MNDDGDHKLVLADKDNKIKIYKGTNVLFEDNLITTPIAVEVFYENNKKPLIPIVAIAAEDKLMLYLKYKQYYLYILPAIEISKEEEDIWKNMQSQAITIEEGVDKLNLMRDNGADLCTQTVELLALESLEEQAKYTMEKSGKPLYQCNYIT